MGLRGLRNGTAQRSTIGLFGSLFIFAAAYSSLFIFVILVYIYLTLRILHEARSSLASFPSSAVILFHFFDIQETKFWILTGGFAAIETAVMLFFWSRIYKPIIFLKKSMDSIADESSWRTSNDMFAHGLYSLGASINSIKARMRELLDAEYAAKLLTKQAELSALQSQINPHFLYNTLESIRSQAIFEGVESIAKMTKALSSMFRYSISQKESIVSFAQEMRNTENYLTIQQFRFFSKFSIIKEFDESDPRISECRMPNLTIQPIVENAIYHGLEKKRGTGTVRISAYATQIRIVITIEDDGMGMSEQQVREHNRLFSADFEQIVTSQRLDRQSIGLSNVNERIKLSFGSEYGLHIYSTLKIGTKVEIALPLLQAGDSALPTRGDSCNEKRSTSSTPIFSSRASEPSPF